MMTQKKPLTLALPSDRRNTVIAKDRLGRVVFEIVSLAGGKSLMVRTLPRDDGASGLVIEPHSGNVAIIHAEEVK